MVASKRCVLVADDEMKMVRALKDLLIANDFEVMEAYDGNQALDMFYSNNATVDLVLLDVMMPGMDGFAVLADLRDNNSLVPVIMLTARGEEYDQVKGFSSGADDYIKKPFSPSLLLARIESILRRVGKDSQSDICKGDIVLNATTRTATNKQILLELTKREFDLLLFLMSNPSAIFSREQLLDNVWGYDFDGDMRTIDTHIKQLRIKLGENSGYIKTVHRVGYKFEV